MSIVPTKRKSVRLLVPWNRNQKGSVVTLAEPVADTLIRQKIGEAYAEDKPMSEPGTKAVSSGKTEKKGGGKKEGGSGADPEKGDGD